MITNIIMACSLYYGALFNIDPVLIRAVARVESANKPDAVSPDGHDIGLMQVRKMYVPETRAQLFDTCTSIRVGTRILSHAKQFCKHNKEFTYVICYNAGVRGGSKIRYPKKFPYYQKVMRFYELELKRKEREVLSPLRRKYCNEYCRTTRD